MWLCYFLVGAESGYHVLENYEEMELETMESSSTQSKIVLINSYGITLNHDSSVRRLNHKDLSNTR